MNRIRPHSTDIVITFQKRQYTPLPLNGPGEVETDGDDDGSGGGDDLSEIDSVFDGPVRGDRPQFID